MKKVLKKLLENKASLEEPAFYQKVYRLILAEQTYPSDLENILINDKGYVSHFFDISGLQDSCSYRNNRIARKLSYYIIDDTGSLNFKALKESIGLLKRCKYSLGCGTVVDIPRRQHLLKVLEELSRNKDIQLLLMQIGRPLSNPLAENIIRDTLHLTFDEHIDDAAARRAAVSAWLFFLRQNVGSCFATAPAIMIQGEQPFRMLTDFHDLISKGFLTRVVLGEEYTIPLSASWGQGDLRKNFIVHKLGSQIITTVWGAPGFVRAFESSGLIKAEESFEKKRLRSDKIVRAVLKRRFKGAAGFLFISPQEVLKTALQIKYKLTEEQLEGYELSEKNTGSIFFVQESFASDSVRLQCKNFFISYRAAQRAFIMLTDNALLKSWEYSLASMCDTKTDFSRWNLYSSLGLEEQQRDGIGNCIYEKIKEKLALANLEASENHEKYDALFPQVKYLETRVKSIKGETERQWAKVDYQRKVGEMNSYASLRDKCHSKARLFSELFDYLRDLFIVKFPGFFQEVYDADMHDIDSGPYNDSPAGFRLLCKHGRRESSAWTLIYDEDQFIDALSAFFISVENNVLEEPAINGIEDDVGDIITAVVNHIKTREFLSSAFDRMALAHNSRPIENPLDNMDKVDKKPWVYTSGGTTKTLLACYYSLEAEIEEESRWVESPSELLVYLLDKMKYMPTTCSHRYIDNKDASLLMHSPTHAFILKPGMDAFCQGWRDNNYTYTWARDNFIHPKQEAVRSVNLNNGMMKYILKTISQSLQVEYRSKFLELFPVLPLSLSIKDFRNYILKDIRRDSVVSKLLGADAIDGLLYNSLPLTDGYRLHDVVLEVLEGLMGVDMAKVRSLYQQLSSPSKREEYYTAEEVQDICKALLILSKGAIYNSKEYHSIINNRAIELKAAFPAPLIFADTNWVKDYFAFCINPGTEELEFWAVNYIGGKGRPLSHWSHWLDGSRQSPSWGLYTNPRQYGLMG